MQLLRLSWTRLTGTSVFLLSSLTLNACCEVSAVAISSGTGLQSTWPEPKTSLIPTLNIAPDKGWPFLVQVFHKI